LRVWVARDSLGLLHYIFINVLLIAVLVFFYIFIFFIECYELLLICLLVVLHCLAEWFDLLFSIFKLFKLLYCFLSLLLQLIHLYLFNISTFLKPFLIIKHYLFVDFIDIFNLLLVLLRSLIAHGLTLLKLIISWRKSKRSSRLQVANTIHKARFLLFLIIIL
jgi:hypothetical protein